MASSGALLALVGAGAGAYFGGPAGAQLGFALGSAAGGGGGSSSSGGLLGGGSDRLKRINPARVSGNLFAQACVRYGVGSPQCPRSELQAFANVAQRRYPNAFARILNPLLQRGQSEIGLAGLQQLNRQYLQKRQAAPDFQRYAALAGGGGSGRAAAGGLRL